MIPSCVKVLSVLLAAAHVVALSCQSDSGGPIDHWTLLKYSNGFTYSYGDSSHEGFVPSTAGSLDAQKGAAWNTLSQIYGKSSSKVAYAMWNDQKPDGAATGGRAHSKGILAFDGKQGFWIIHSMPKWPNFIAGGYKGLPDDTFGQHFHCVTFPLSEIDKIAAQLQVTWPWIYDMNLPNGFNSTMKNFVGFLDGDHTRDSTANAQPLKSSGGTPFTMFAKNKQSSINLYEELVAYELQSDMYVRTWQNGVGNLGSFCRPKYEWEVEDISEITLNGDTYNIHQDHSKWAISATTGYDVVCFGGINRQASQTKRGGGTLCHSSKAAHASLLQVATDTNTCTKFNKLSGLKQAVNQSAL